MVTLQMSHASSFCLCSFSNRQAIDKTELSMLYVNRIGHFVCPGLLACVVLVFCLWRPHFVLFSSSVQIFMLGLKKWFVKRTTSACRIYLAVQTVERSNRNLFVFVCLLDLIDLISCPFFFYLILSGANRRNQPSASSDIGEFTDDEEHRPVENQQPTPPPMSIRRSPRKHAARNEVVEPSSPVKSKGQKRAADVQDQMDVADGETRPGQVGGEEVGKGKRCRHPSPMYAGDHHREEARRHHSRNGAGDLSDDATQLPDGATFDNRRSAEVESEDSDGIDDLDEVDQRLFLAAGRHGGRVHGTLQASSSTESFLFTSPDDLVSQTGRIGGECQTGLDLEWSVTKSLNSNFILIVALMYHIQIALMFMHMQITRDVIAKPRFFRGAWRDHCFSAPFSRWQARTSTGFQIARKPLSADHFFLFFFFLFFVRFLCFSSTTN